ncbi:hypothetical protein ACIA8G_25285 [Lentzea sp. NPDC051213]|uniref:hypothetical protein n=1 Tax=Lentzea sp. NPDC051213 TaxID=3364126 RepID=UPI0037AB7C12
MATAPHRGCSKQIQCDARHPLLAPNGCVYHSVIYNRMKSLRSWGGALGIRQEHRFRSTFPGGILKSHKLTRRARKIGAASLLFATLLTPVAAADDKKPASPGITDKATLELMKKQHEIGKVADRIEEARPETDATGLSGFYVDAKQNRLKVYWKGDVSKAALQAIEQAQAKGVTVEVIPAPYTRAHLRAEVKRLGEVNMTGARVDGPSLVSAALKYDGTGIVLGVSGMSANVTTADARNAIPGIASAVETEVVPDEMAADTSRWDDIRPFYGGGYIERRVNGTFAGSCTSGFAAQAGGLTFMATAAHCGTGDHFTGAGTYIGATAGAVDVAHDTQLIVTESAPLIFDGGSIWNERPQFTKTVSGASGTRTGEYVCVSGALSGAACPILVEQTGVSYRSQSGLKIDMVRGGRETIPRRAAAGNGDSGAPVFSLDGDARVVIRGVQTAGTNVPELWDPCEGVPGEGQPGGLAGRRCSHRIYFSDVTFTMRALGITVRTG